MGLDGFTMKNISPHNELTSAQLANNAEALAQKGNQRIIKDVESLAEKQKTKNKEFEEDDESVYYIFNKDEESEDELSQNNKKQKKRDPNKKYTVKLNKKTQLIELIDIEQNKVIETILPNDLIKLVSKLNETSGILVNKKV